MIQSMVGKVLKLHWRTKWSELGIISTKISDDIPPISTIQRSFSTEIK